MENIELDVDTHWEAGHKVGLSNLIHAQHWGPQMAGRLSPGVTLSGYLSSPAVVTTREIFMSLINF